MRKLLSIMALFAAFSWAADLTGNWSGPMEIKQDGETRNDTAHLVLTQTGNTIQGTAQRNGEEQLPIKKGSIEGSNVLLEVTIPDKEGKVILRLKVEGDKLVGDLKSEGPDLDPMTGKMTLTRAK